MLRRQFHVGIPFKYEVSLIKYIVKNQKPVVQTENKLRSSNKIPRPYSLKILNNSHSEKLKLEPKWLDLYKKHNYIEYTTSDLNYVNNFFNSTDVRFEWSSVSQEEYENPDGTVLELEDSTLTNHMKKVSKERILPEVVFLGSSNVGKSTLLNSLVTNFQRSSLENIARASRRAGYTKSLNFFNIGNRFRLVDTPGYGYNSTTKQGNLTMMYIKNRKQLMKCYLLISSEKGFGSNDFGIIDDMQENGIPFEIVFTKMDKLKNIEGFEKQIEGYKLDNVNKLPQFYFTNSETSKKIHKRFGLDILRLSIIQSCGLSIGLKPIKIK